jgi:NADH:quinone reductase (non-electrogenic)
METSAAKKRILILGGGFAGAYTALHLEKRLGGRPDVDVTLIARENFILFTPMLSEVAGGDVEVMDIVYSLRKMLRRTHVTIADVEMIDLAKKQVRIVHSGSRHTHYLAYDQLVLALGAVTNFHGNPGLEKHALTMKTLGDAILVRNRAIDALGLADNQPDETERKTTLTLVIAGGGFAGVETAGAVNDLMRETMKFYPNLKESTVRIVVAHAGKDLLPELSESLGRYAEKQLTRRGIEVFLKTEVTSYDGKEVTFSDGSRIATRMLIWTAGITPPPLLSTLPCAIERGRILANERLEVPNWPGVWALGDCALVPDQYNPGKFYPPTAQHATRQAALLANNIVAALRGQAPEPFKFKIIGLLATIGRRTGVAEIFGLRFSGFVAWLLWRSIYLSKLPGLQKKIRVALDWALDLIFSKDLVELPTLREITISEAEESSKAVGGRQ